MKNLLNTLGKNSICVALLICFVMNAFTPVGIADISQQNDTQRNAISMLNYITMLTQDINASKNSRLYMEEAYSTLVNNIYPESVDSRTLDQMYRLLDIMEDHRMVDIKRDRLKYIFDQNRAQAIRTAVPNPLGLLSTVHSFSLSRIASAIAYMAVDSITSYNTYTAASDLEYLMDGWALDDEEAAIIHDSRKSAFNRMIKMVDENDLPRDLTLSENAVSEFVRWKNDENTVARIQFLESNQNAYQSYGGYWLLLIVSYYNNRDYTKVLESVENYETNATHFFYKDYEFARVLPLVVSAANETLEGDEYINTVSRYAQLILNNTESDDWSLRYFAAQSFIDLYSRTQEASYLRKAYDVALENANNLLIKQKTMNRSFIEPIQEVPIPDEPSEDASKEAKEKYKSEKNQIKSYNKMLKSSRKTELPPVSEPLLLNCELLCALADKMELQTDERKKVDEILHPNGEPAFLNQPLDAKYWFDSTKQTIESDEVDIEFDGTEIILPVEFVSEQSQIIVEIKELGSDVSTMLIDWCVDEVERNHENELSSYKVVYTSKSAKQHDWQPDSYITVNILPKTGIEMEALHFVYVTHNSKNEWYDYLKVWEGHRNNWYDYAKVWENSVLFERIK